MTKFRIIATSICLITLLLPASYSYADQAENRRWVEDMKEAGRGPFSRIRWFCKDGSVLAPQPYACSDYGGGVQHGEWNRQTKALREQGYYIATLLADENKALTVNPAQADQFKQLLIERYLIAIDDGWIMRKARYYRGSMQAEDEVRGARNTLITLAQSEDWLTQGFVVLRTGVHVLPHGIDTPSVLKVRQMAIDLSSQDRKFLPLRNKIHISPDASDAKAVREYAADFKKSKAKKYLKFADMIDEIYARPALNIPIDRLSKRVRKLPDISRSLRDMSARLISSRDPSVLFAATARTMAVLRDHIVDVKKSGVRLDVLDTSVLLEAEHFDLGRELLSKLDTVSRAQRLSWLRSSLQATYGTGVLSRRQLDAMDEALDRLDQEDVSLEKYLAELSYLSRVPGWAGQNLRFSFYEPLQKLAEIEPRAELFIQDQLRGGPLLFYVEVLDSLIKDANGLAGISHNLFDEDVGTGLRSLNPGLARGVLYLTGINETVGSREENFDSEGIYLLNQTVAELPPVAGILTAGEGNPLSHVQLLARNLGIPNVSVDETLIAKLKPYENKRVILAVSQGGVVSLFEDDGKHKDLFESNGKKPVVSIKPDLEKLELENDKLVPLSELRTTDSGRTVGPKAAKLGELHHHFPEAVANGLTIPFAVFRQLVDKSMPGTGKSVFDWMVEQYELMDALPEDSKERQRKEVEFRKKLVRWIENSNPGEDLKLRLSKAMEEVFGEEGSYGVFVRSDTNVEDLPDFTGAGLNLTVPNVVGFDEVVKAIRKVWASPFSKRALAWRQSQMDEPQHVYPAVLLMRSVPVEKSGVMVTQDIDNGDDQWLSIAVNEGVGGAVDGQEAESIKVDVKTADVRLLAQATARTRRLISDRGGMIEKPVTGTDTILKDAEIKQLIDLSKTIHENYPDLTVTEGESTHKLPADIEFGFLDGQLQLFQIRPFVENANARESEFLLAMDRSVSGEKDINIQLNEIPE